MRIVVVGAGGHGRVVAWIVRAAGEHELVAFADEEVRVPGERVLDLPVLGGPGALEGLRDQGIEGAALGKGDNRERARWAEAVRTAGLRLVSAIHPSALIHASARLGEGVVVATGAIVCPHADIGEGTIVNTGAIVEHDDVLGRFVHVAPGTCLAGRVRIGEFSFVGIGSSVRDNTTIGAHVTVGAGSVVVRDVPDGLTVAGVPARPLVRVGG